VRIVLLEPYDTGSHHAWMVGYRAHSAHDITILSLQGYFWKWRMHGGAVTLARMYLEADLRPDLILATDMLDLTTFLALTRRGTAGIPTAIYFHENQLTYPLGPRQRPEWQNHLAFINYASALAADQVLFNSRYHQDAFFDELPRLLKHYPDHTELGSIARLRAKSAVLPPGLDLRRLDDLKPAQQRKGLPLILWNHRWEYDKNPRAFLNALLRLAKEGVPFEVALTGENVRQSAEEFEAARTQLGSRVVQYGYVARFEDYARLLWEADVQVSTAYHDFFGLSTVEALYCGCAALLPRRLNYPDLIPAQYHARFLYHEGEIFHILWRTLTTPETTPADLRKHVSRYDWSIQGPEYDRVFEALAAG
jgi:glycosyltransferase involved in cell wall biosynthesis